MVNDYIQIRKKTITAPLVIQYLKAMEKETGKSYSDTAYHDLLCAAKKWEANKNTLHSDSLLAIEIKRILDKHNSK